MMCFARNCRVLIGRDARIVVSILLCNEFHDGIHGGVAGAMKYDYDLSISDIRSTCVSRNRSLPKASEAM